jgi:cytochrome c-type biogenesis protein CcmE
MPKNQLTITDRIAAIQTELTDLLGDMVSKEVSIVAQGEVMEAYDALENATKAMRKVTPYQRHWYETLGQRMRGYGTDV